MVMAYHILAFRPNFERTQSYINQKEDIAGLSGEINALSCDWYLYSETGAYPDVYCSLTLISELSQTYIDIAPAFKFATDITIRDDNNHLVVFNSQGVYPNVG